MLPPVLPPSCVTRLGPGNTGPPVSTSTSCRVIASMPTRRSSKLVWLLLIVAFASLWPGALGTAAEMSVRSFFWCVWGVLNRPKQSRQLWSCPPNLCTGTFFGPPFEGAPAHIFGHSCACNACAYPLPCHRLESLPCWSLFGSLLTLGSPTSRTAHQKELSTLPTLPAGTQGARHPLTLSTKPMHAPAPGVSYNGSANDRVLDATSRLAVLQCFMCAWTC